MMTDAPEPSSDDVRARELTIYADAIISGQLRWKSGRWQFGGVGTPAYVVDIQEAAEAAAAFLRRLGMLGKGKA